MMKKHILAVLLISTLLLTCSCSPDPSDTIDADSSSASESASDTGDETSDKDLGWTKDYL